MPSYIFYDNNCQFLKHLRSCDDHYFDNVGLPVDVFHFKCKHTEKDTFCQINCNPACFKELIGSDGKWIFNSSAAEQANVWFGKFQNIVQEMPVLRYSFLSIWRLLISAHLSFQLQFLPWRDDCNSQWNNHSRIRAFRPAATFAGARVTTGRLHVEFTKGKINWRPVLDNPAPLNRAACSVVPLGSS